jgi:hypothetical protein
MKAVVTEHGLTIPKELLKGVEEVEIQMGKTRIFIIPLSKKDPIQNLGAHPLACSAPDASVKHDTYIYGKTS